MKNSPIFEEALEQASGIRSHIQEKLRKRYKAYQKAFGIAAETDGKKLKFITDMLYYQYGGYPNENSLPKHEEILNAFIDLVKFIQFIGGHDELTTDYLQQHGITIQIHPQHRIENKNIDGDTLHKAEQALKEYDSHLTLQPCDLRTLLSNFLVVTKDIQREICNKSDEIKHNLANVVENNCGIKRSDFIGAVQFEVLNKKNKINPQIILRERDNFNSKVDVFQAKVEKVRSRQNSETPSNSQPE